MCKKLTCLQTGLQNGLLMLSKEEENKLPDALKINGKIVPRKNV